MIVGIDLGTTHSLIGVFEGSAARLIPNALGELLTPSAVSVDDAGKIIVGRAAHDRLVSHPDRSVTSFKRWMGTPRETKLGERSFRPEELSALVLRSLIDDAEANLGAKIEEAVISVPAYFSDTQRRATRAAGELAGIRVERLINEPTAAALAYGLQAYAEGSIFMVLDLGGGTFDVSILELFDGVMQVRASAGDNHLGGDDFLEVLVNACLHDLKIDKGQLKRSELAHVYHRLNDLKHRLSQKHEAGTDLNLQSRTSTWSIDEQRFAVLAESLLQRLRTPVERALRDARLGSEKLSQVVLVGGASRMPIFSRLVARMMGRLPLRQISPDQAIALGASVAAGMKERNVALEEIVMTDVCPYTLGIEITRVDPSGQATAGYFEPLIERNSTVPCSRVKRFFPIRDGQQTLVLKVYQGENPMVARNAHLGSLHIPLVATLPKSENGVDVRFTYDINGVLQVEGTLEATRSTHELILQNNTGVLDDQEIRERLAQLASLKVHPREEQENIALIARCERLYEELLEARPTLQEWIMRFNSVLNTQDKVMVERTRVDLVQRLDDLENYFRK